MVYDVLHATPQNIGHSPRACGTYSGGWRPIRVERAGCGWGHSSRDGLANRNDDITLRGRPRVWYFWPFLRTTESAERFSFHQLRRFKFHPAGPSDLRYSPGPRVGPYQLLFLFYVSIQSDGYAANSRDQHVLRFLCRVAG